MGKYEYYEPGEKPRENQGEDLLPRTRQELEDKVLNLYRKMTSGPELMKEEWYMFKGWIDCLHWVLKTAQLPDEQQYTRPGERPSLRDEPIRAKRYLTERK